MYSSRIDSFTQNIRSFCQYSPRPYYESFDHTITSHATMMHTTHPISNAPRFTKLLHYVTKGENRIEHILFIIAIHTASKFVID